MTSPDASASPSSDTEPLDDTEATEGDSRDEQVDDDIDQLLDELRAEVSRLKADYAQSESQTWAQRHPYLAVMGATGLGAVAGYSIAVALRPAPRPPLTDRARRRLRRLTEEAHDVAGKLSEDVQRQASDVGTRLAEDAQDIGTAARTEAESLAASASEGAQKAGEDASRALQEATNRLVTRLRKQNGASEAKVQQIVDRIREAVSTSDEDARGGLGSSLLSVAGLAVGGYLLRRLL